MKIMAIVEHARCSRLKLTPIIISWIGVITIVWISIVKFSEASDEHQVCGRVVTSEGRTIYLRENTTLSQKEFEKVHVKKLNGAKFVPVSERNCVIQVCGFTSFDTPYGRGLIGSSSDYSDCRKIIHSETASSTIYNSLFNTSSLSCACLNKNHGCRYTCEVKRQHWHHKWKDDDCALLFQDEDCNNCYYNPIPIAKNEVFATDVSHHINSVFVRDGCLLRQNVPAFKRYWRFRNYTSPIKYDSTYIKKVMSAFYNEPEIFTCTCIDTLEMQMNETATLATELPIIADKVATTTPLTTPSSDALDYTSYEPIILIIFPALGILLAIPGAFLVFYKIRKKRPSPPIPLQNMTMNSDDLKKTINLLFQLAKKQQNELLGSEAQPNLGSDNVDLLGKFQEECKPEFQLPRVSFQFERNKQSKLGSGLFGDVYKGVLVQDPNSDAVFENVAVKVVKVLKDSENVAMSFLNEIRYFQIVGNAHPNVVTFIGACFFEGELYLLTKLCEKGSLKKYLNSVKRLAWVSDHNSGTSYIFQNDDQNQSGAEAKPSVSLRTKDLLQLVSWSEQIASGMQFLHSKGIIHGDLATRNVLLCNDLTAKICDYGLSVQCAEEKYAKVSLTKNKIPFNSLAPEIVNALNNPEMEITRMPRQIDVWAFGCTLWEIFTLGESPFADMEQALLVPRLPIRLHEVLKQPAPRTPPQIHEKLLECWNEIPEKRPSFTELCSFFEAQRGQLIHEFS